MSNSNIPSIGRFSSQMLTYLGTQRIVQQSGNYAFNQFIDALGPTFYVEPGSAQQSNLGAGVVVGSVSSTTFDVIKGYFLSRGASSVYADTMTMLTVDICAILGITPMSFVEQIDQQGIIYLNNSLLSAFNLLRSPGNQIANATSVNNRKSSVSNQVRG